MQVILTARAKRDLTRLPKAVQSRIVQALAQQERMEPRQFRRLRGSKLYSLRIGEYRALGRPIGRTRFLVKHIGHRKNVYDRVDE